MDAKKPEGKGDSSGPHGPKLVENLKRTLFDITDTRYIVTSLVNQHPCVTCLHGARQTSELFGLINITSVTVLYIRFVLRFHTFLLGYLQYSL